MVKILLLENGYERISHTLTIDPEALEKIIDSFEIGNHLKEMAEDALIIALRKRIRFHHQLHGNKLITTIEINSI